MTLGRVNDHACPLVDYYDRIIFVKNRKRDVLRRWSFARCRDLFDDDNASIIESQRCFANGIVDADVTGVDGAPQNRAAELGKLLSEKYI